jgi:hypothetical protein
MPHTKKSEISSHMTGTSSCEEHVKRKGTQTVMETGTHTARDSTAINAKARDPIDPRMPHMPPP